ncbi:hypothetical protein [Vibrio owensii]|uniref:Uncharacterized protein n=1 Tax=Vibrio owensii TaxID=696485 RepID=A0AAP9KC47_9VIBR|nr:hypothetical protein [Vibrio owensii]QGH49242.1 hypothetical protein APZ19_19175 [Vibrio owensii]
MATAFYRNGVVTVTKGSKVVTGNHTTWTGGATKPLPGDVFVFNNKLYEVEVIVSDTELTLYREFEDDTQVDQEYVIMRNASLNISSRIAAAVAIAINQKQQQLDEFNNFLTNTTDPTVDFTDTLGNKVTVIPIPELEREIAELIDNTANIADLVQEAVDAKDGAVAAESNVTAMRDEVTQMKNDVTHMHDNVNTWQQEVSDNKDLAEQAAQATAQDKLATAQDVIDAGNSATAASESATAANTAKEASEAIQADVTSKHGDVEQWHTEVLAAKDSVDASETHVDEVKAEIDALKLDMDSTASEVSDIKDDIDAKYLQINSWHTETGELKDDAEAAAAAAAESAKLAQAAIVPMRNEADMWEMINRNKTKYAASQFVDFGRHKSSVSQATSINEGLWAYVADDAVPNSNLVTGRGGDGQFDGLSNSDFPITAVAGFISQFRDVNNYNEASNGQSLILFPEAPNGTVIYDSSGDCRGSGKVNLDLSVDVDPKYGDVAADTNEAVARAFEGVIKNGDFRNGTTDWLTAGATISSSGANFSGTALQSISSTITGGIVTGKTYTLEVSVTVRAGGYRVYATGGTNQLIANGQSTSGVSKFTFTATGDNFEIDIARDNAVNATFDFDIHSVSLHLASEEVVITPHDVFGMEYWLEEVSLANPDVFDCGMVQSKSASSNGVTTSASSRPQTYHAAFKGDATTGHTSVDFFASTFEDQCKLAAKDSNNLFRLNDGRIVQFRGRQRTIRGMGNGEWFSINPASGLDNSLCYQNVLGALVMPQGSRDAVKGVSYTQNYRNIARKSLTHPEVGVWSVHEQATSDDYGIDNLCFFQVWGEVPRLNQGVYHPSFNPMGTAKTVISGVGWIVWNHSSNDKLKCVANCFKPWTGIDWGAGGGDIASGQGTGTVAGGWRPDGRYYDAIYAGGQGGVIDYRVSAYDMGAPDEAAKIFQKVVNGSYRGKENLVKTIFVGANDADGVVNNSIWFRTGTDGFPEGRNAYDIPIGSPVGGIRADGTGYVLGHVSAHNSSYSIWVRPLEGQQVIRSSNLYMVQINTDSTVSGEFTMVDVIGDPAAILASPDLANGWIGGWIPEIPPSSPYKMTRKCLDSGSIPVKFSDDYVNWTSGAGNVNTTTNEFSGVSVAGRIGIITYTAFAKQTKPSSNKEILNYHNGIGDVYANSYHGITYGCLLNESLMGKVNTSSSGLMRQFMKMSEVYTDSRKLYSLTTYANSNAHSPIRLTAPTNNSPALKAFWYQAANSQQTTLNFAWSELIYNAGGSFVTVNPSTLWSVKGGDIVRIGTGFNNPQMAGNTLRANRSFTDVNWAAGDLDNWGVYGEQLLSDLNAIKPNVVNGFRLNSPNAGWGDDSTIRIIDGTGTYVNLNGDTCLYGTSELAIPYGYTKNQARAGSQVPGVDL